MSNSGLIIPPELHPVVKERSSLWNEFDSAIKKREKLNSLRSQIPEDVPVEPQEETFTFEALPHEELAATLKYLESDLQAIREMESEIDSCRGAIREEEIRIKRNRIATRIIIGMVVLLVIYTILSAAGVF
jgi:hypothetical protein